MHFGLKWVLAAFHGEMQVALFPSAGAQEGRADALGREPCRLGALLPSLSEDHWPHLFPRMVNPIPGLRQPHKPTESGFEPI